MNTPVSNERDIHRLLDIVVEEVSLVDRAANKHRFLIVKRSHDMDEEMTPTAEATDLNADTGADPSTGWDDSNDSQAADDPKPTPHGKALAVAVQALEQLTAAVELLASEDRAESTRLSGLAAELHSVASQLAALANGSDPSTGTGSQDDALSAFLGSIEQALGQAKGLMGERPQPNTGAPSENQPRGASGPTPSAALSKQLGELTEAMRGLSTSIAQQQQRLARLEKHHGLPNSKPSGEQPVRREVEDAGWPLDLNKPYDRESVDKAVSFHDV
jgi:hypothetical protein